MIPLCPFVDDSVDEATALANQLRKNGVPFDIRPVVPASTTLATYRLLTAARPCAVMVDYYLSACPGTKSEDLARRLANRGWPTVFLTKDRDVADRQRIPCDGRIIPVFYKHRLISDISYVEQMVQGLGGQAKAEGVADYTERLDFLQHKALSHSLSKKERDELETLLARLSLDESEESARIERAQVCVQEKVDSLIDLIQQVSAGLNDELRTKHAVRAKSKHS